MASRLTLSDAAIAVLIVAAVTTGSSLQAQQQPTPPAPNIPDQFAFTITGRLLTPNSAPLAGMEVLVSETDCARPAIAWQTGSDGRLINPRATTDASGRFRITADRRFWARTGCFTLQGGLIPGTMEGAGILRGEANAPVLVTPAPRARSITLGDIVVRRQQGPPN